MFEPGHPIISRKDWLQFSGQLSLYFSQAIDREQLDLPYWFLPLAGGVIVASPALLHRTGYKVGGPQPLGWTRVKAAVFQLKVGKTRLRVRRTNDGRFWIVSRWPPGVPMHSDKDSETLVHLFGSTPLVTKTLDEMLHLAYWFETNNPIASLHWSKASPGFLIGVLAFAIRRAESEGMKLSLNDLWVSSAHSRRMKSGRARYKNSQLLPPVDVKYALWHARLRAHLLC
jgi:hypothetical protein